MAHCSCMNSAIELTKIVGECIAGEDQWRARLKHLSKLTPSGLACSSHICDFAEVLRASSEVMPAWWEKDTRYLRLLRAVAIAATMPQRQCDEAEQKEAPAEQPAISHVDWCRLRWVDYLLDDDSSRRGVFFKFLDRAGETYRAARPCWTWCKPGRVTVPEYELALVLFGWGSPDEKWIAGWAKRRHPQVLWRVHQFLLQRYCFDLIQPFRRALKAHSALEWVTRLYPRIWGLTFIGFFVQLGVSPLLNVFFDRTAVAAAASLLAGSLAYVLVLAIDVRKRNRGVLLAGRELTNGLSIRSDSRIIRRRVLSLWWRSALISATLGIILWLGLQNLQWRDGGLRGEAVRWVSAIDFWPPSFSPVDWGVTAHFLLGFAAWCTTASLIGSLIEWVWQDTSLTEPF